MPTEPTDHEKPTKPPHVRHVAPTAPEHCTSANNEKNLIGYDTWMNNMLMDPVPAEKTLETSASVLSKRTPVVALKQKTSSQHTVDPWEQGTSSPGSAPTVTPDPTDAEDCVRAETLGSNTRRCRPLNDLGGRDPPVAPVHPTLVNHTIDPVKLDLNDPSDAPVPAVGKMYAEACSFSDRLGADTRWCTTFNDLGCVSEPLPRTGSTGKFNTRGAAVRVVRIVYTPNTDTVVLPLIRPVDVLEANAYNVVSTPHNEVQQSDYFNVPSAIKALKGEGLEARSGNVYECAQVSTPGDTVDGNIGLPRLITPPWFLERQNLKEGQDRQFATGTQFVDTLATPWPVNKECVTTTIIPVGNLLDPVVFGDSNPPTKEGLVLGSPGALDMAANATAAAWKGVSRNHAGCSTSAWRVCQILQDENAKADLDSDGRPMYTAEQEGHKEQLINDALDGNADNPSLLDPSSYGGDEAVLKTQACDRIEAHYLPDVRALVGDNESAMGIAARLLQTPSGASLLVGTSGQIVVHTWSDLVYWTTFLRWNGGRSVPHYNSMVAAKPHAGVAARPPIAGCPLWSLPLNDGPLWRVASVPPTQPRSETEHDILAAVRSEFTQESSSVLNHYDKEFEGDSDCRNGTGLRYRELKLRNTRRELIVQLPTLCNVPPLRFMFATPPFGVKNGTMHLLDIAKDLFLGDIKPSILRHSLYAWSREVRQRPLLLSLFPTGRPPVDPLTKEPVWPFVFSWGLIVLATCVDRLRTHLNMNVVPSMQRFLVPKEESTAYVSGRRKETPTKVLTRSEIARIRLEKPVNRTLVDVPLAVERVVDRYIRRLRVQLSIAVLPLQAHVPVDVTSLVSDICTSVKHKVVYPGRYERVSYGPFRCRHYHSAQWYVQRSNLYSRSRTGHIPNGSDTFSSTPAVLLSEVNIWAVHIGREVLAALTVSTEALALACMHGTVRLPEAMSVRDIAPRLLLTLFELCKNPLHEPGLFVQDRSTDDDTFMANTPPFSTYGAETFVTKFMLAAVLLGTQVACNILLPSVSPLPDSPLRELCVSSDRKVAALETKLTKSVPVPKQQPAADEPFGELRWPLRWTTFSRTNTKEAARSRDVFRACNGLAETCSRFAQTQNHMFPIHGVTAMDALGQAWAQQCATDFVASTPAGWEAVIPDEAAEIVDSFGEFGSAPRRLRWPVVHIQTLDQWMVRVGTPLTQLFDIAGRRADHIASDVFESSFGLESRSPSPSVVNRDLPLFDLQQPLWDPAILALLLSTAVLLGRDATIGPFTPSTEAPLRFGLPYGELVETSCVTKETMRSRNPSVPTNAEDVNRLLGVLTSQGSYHERQRSLLQYASNVEAHAWQSLPPVASDSHTQLAPPPRVVVNKQGTIEAVYKDNNVCLERAVFQTIQATVALEKRHSVGAGSDTARPTHPLGAVLQNTSRDASVAYPRVPGALCLSSGPLVVPNVVAANEDDMFTEMLFGSDDSDNDNDTDDDDAVRLKKNLFLLHPEENALNATADNLVSGCVGAAEALGNYMASAFLINAPYIKNAAQIVVRTRLDSSTHKNPHQQSNHNSFKIVQLALYTFADCLRSVFLANETLCDYTSGGMAAAVFTVAMNGIHHQLGIPNGLVPYSANVHAPLQNAITKAQRTCFPASQRIYLGSPCVLPGSPSTYTTYVADLLELEGRTKDTARLKQLDFGQVNSSLDQWGRFALCSIAPTQASESKLGEYLLVAGNHQRVREVARNAAAALTLSRPRGGVDIPFFGARRGLRVLGNAFADYYSLVGIAWNRMSLAQIKKLREEIHSAKLAHQLDRSSSTHHIILRLDQLVKLPFRLYDITLVATRAAAENKQRLS
jgi:hypothetical protein